MLSHFIEDFRRKSRLQGNQNARGSEEARIEDIDKLTGSMNGEGAETGRGPSSIR